MLTIARVGATEPSSGSEGQDCVSRDQDRERNLVSHPPSPEAQVSNGLREEEDIGMDGHRTDKRHGLNRRSLLAGAGAGIAALAAASALPAASGLAQTAAGRSPIMRAIPKTGERIPVIGLGTFETFDVSPGEPRDHMGVFLFARVADLSDVRFALICVQFEIWLM